MDNLISLGSKSKMINSFVISVLLLACEAWARETNANLKGEIRPMVTENFPADTQR